MFRGVRSTVIVLRTALATQAKWQAPAKIQNVQVQNMRSMSFWTDFKKKMKDAIEKDPEMKKAMNEFKQKTQELRDSALFKEASQIKENVSESLKEVQGKAREAADQARGAAEKAKESANKARDQVNKDFGLGKKEGTKSAEETESFFRKDNSTTSSTSSSSNTYSSTSDRSASSKGLFGKIAKSFASFAEKVSPVTQTIKEELASENKYDRYEPKSTASASTPKENTTKDQEYQPPPEANTSETGLVIRPETAWEQGWRQMRERKVIGSMLGVGEKLAGAGDWLVANLGDRLFKETEMSLVLSEIKEVDPQFNLYTFPDYLREHKIPTVMNAFLRADLEALKPHFTEAAFATVSAMLSDIKSQGLSVDDRILDLDEIDLMTCQILNDKPTLVYRFQVQQVHCIKDSTGKIVDGAEDELRKVFYVWAIQQQCDDENDPAHWRIVEMLMAGAMKMLY